MKKDSNFIHLNDYFRIHPNFFKIILLMLFGQHRPDYDIWMSSSTKSCISHFSSLFIG